MGLWQSLGLHPLLQHPEAPTVRVLLAVEAGPHPVRARCPFPISSAARGGSGWGLGHSQLSPCTLVLETLLFPCPPLQDACESLELPLYCEGDGHA